MKVKVNFVKSKTFGKIYDFTENHSDDIARILAGSVFILTVCFCFVMEYLSRFGY